MNKKDYEDELLKILRTHTAQAKQNLSEVLTNLPEKANTIQFGVFPAQDGDGTFSVNINLYGPDLYVLNKAIDGFRTMFEVRHTEMGLSPKVPLFEFDETDFEVNDVIVDAAAVWIKELWDSVAKNVSPIPALIFGDEDYGTHAVIHLPTIQASVL